MQRVDVETKNLKRSMFTDMDIQELIKEYELGNSMAQLSRKYDISTYKVKKYLKIIILV